MKVFVAYDFPVIDVAINLSLTDTPDPEVEKGRFSIIGRMQTDDNEDSDDGTYDIRQYLQLDVEQLAPSQRAKIADRITELATFIRGIDAH